jgi:hypothetical protein
MNPLDIIFDLIYGWGNLTAGVSGIVFGEIPLIGYSVFDFFFSPATWILVFGFVLAKKLVPAV